MPSVTTAALSQSSAEWKGPVVPLNLGLRCPAGPETNVTMSMEVVPGVSDTGTGTGNNVIASKKLRDNSEGPDLLLVNTGSGNSAVSFQPVLELPGTGACQARSINGADCLQLSGSGPDYSIPLGLQMLLPAQSSFSTPEMRKPGIWSATVTLNIRYQ